MIYTMSTKTLVKEFTPLFTPEEILGCTFIPFSNKIVSNKGCITFNQTVLFGLDNEVALEINTKIIEDGLVLNYSDLEMVIEIVRKSLAFPDDIFIILSTPKETRTQYPYYLAKTIEQMFCYPVIDFKTGRDKEYRYDMLEVVEKIEFWTAKYYKEAISSFPDNIKKFNKKKKKRILKILGLYSKGMTEEEMDSELVYDQRLPFRL